MTGPANANACIAKSRSAQGGRRRRAGCNAAGLGFISPPGIKSTMPGTLRSHCDNRAADSNSASSQLNGAFGTLLRVEVPTGSGTTCGIADSNFSNVSGKRQCPLRLECRSIVVRNGESSLDRRFRDSTAKAGFANRRLE